MDSAESSEVTSPLQTKLAWNHRAGMGRPKGARNKLTRQRYEFVEMVVGKEDSDERKEFTASIRKQIMNGTCPPAIALTVMHWWLGKPTEKIELSRAPVDLSALTDEELADRAVQVATVLTVHPERELPALPAGEDEPTTQ